MPMDRIIKRKRITPARIGYFSVILVIVILAIYGLNVIGGASTLRISADRLTISEVIQNEFLEYISVNGAITPINTFYLDAVQGGQVLTISLEEGCYVSKGDTIIQLDNTDLLLDIMYREAQLYEQENNLRNTRLAIQQNSLMLRGQLLDIDREIGESRREFEQAHALKEEGLISKFDHDRIKEDYNYWISRRELTIETQKQDSILRTAQLEQIEASVARMNANQEIVKRKLENLTVTAPVAGHLTSLQAEVGELKTRGERLGQIDILDGFKIRADVDEYYISSVNDGQVADATISGKIYPMKVTKVYTEVRNGRFQIDLEFEISMPEGIRRGQTVSVKLVLGDPSQAVLVPRGAFYNSTGGQWIFVLDESGKAATKREISIGNYNPHHYEILRGLAPGEKVITSSYDNLIDFEKLILTN